MILVLGFFECHVISDSTYLPVVYSFLLSSSLGRPVVSTRWDITYLFVDQCRRGGGQRIFSTYGSVPPYAL